MQSKTLCFNQTLYRKNLTRFWPLWVVPSFVGALFPLALLTQLIRYGSEGIFGNAPQNHGLEFTGIYYQVVGYVVPILSLCYAILVALAVWSYLYNNRSVGLMHTLPVRREGLFLTNFLSGMTMMLAPYVVTGALCIVISLCYGFFDPVGLLVTILSVIGESFFYFCTATAVAFVTGNLFALPVLYFIFHFLAAGMDFLISVFANGFLFGVESEYTGTVEFLSPTVYFMNHVRADHEYREVFVPDTALGSVTPEGVGYYTSELVSVTLENAWVIAVYALVGVVVLAAAYALYRRRRSESAGDVVAVGWMKPVFRYGVAICASMAGGMVLYAVFWGSFRDGEYYDVIPLLFCMLISGAIGYYAASMLLAKSLRVFRGSWKGLAAVALCSAAICGVLKFDLLGIETRIPAVSQIETLYLRVGGNNYGLTPEDDADLIEEIRAVQLAIIQDQDYIVDLQENWRYDTAAEDQVSAYNSVRLEYGLKNGTEVIRRYSVPITRERLQQSGTYDFALTQLINSEAMKAERFHLNGDLRPYEGYLYVDARETHYDGNFGAREALAIHEAVRKDVMAGTCGNYDWFDNSRINQYAADLDLQFKREEMLENGEMDIARYDSINIRLYPEMTHTVNALVELDLVKASELKTYGQLYPEDYAEEKYELYAGYAAVPAGIDVSAAVIYPDDRNPSSFPETDVNIIAGSADAPAASVGIIGGADGPTSIIVSG